MKEAPFLPVRKYNRRKCFEGGKSIFHTQKTHCKKVYKILIFFFASFVRIDFSMNNKSTTTITTTITVLLEQPLVTKERYMNLKAAAATLIGFSCVKLL